MSRDPYLDVKREVEQNLSAINGLLSNQGGSSNHGLVEELRGTLSLLEADLEDLDETVRVIEETGERWGIQESEVRSRRNFVQRVKSEAGDLKRKIANMGGGDRKGKGRARDQQGYRDVPLDLGDGQEDDAEEARRWEAEEQQTLMRRQDDTLGFISGTLTNLASQAGLIGQEVGEQSEMLDDLGNRVDNTDSRLRKVQKTMNDFIRRNEETKSGWCICILIVVLIILLVLVILT